MFGLFKVRDRGNSPDELVHYCEKNNLPGLGLMVLIAHLSGMLVEECTAPEDDLPKIGYKTIHFYCYLIAYASWIGAKRGKFPNTFSHAWGDGAIKHLPDERVLTPKGRSLQLCRFLWMHYQRRENFKIAERFYGTYTTDATVDEFAIRIRDFLFRNFLWINLGFTDTTFAAYMRRINEDFVAPMVFYGEEQPTVRNFWTLAFLAEWAFPEREDTYTPVPKGSHVFGLMLHSLKQISEIVDKTVFPSGLDR